VWRRPEELLQEVSIARVEPIIGIADNGTRLNGDRYAIRFLPAIEFKSILTSSFHNHDKEDPRQEIRHPARPFEHYTDQLVTFRSRTALQVQT